MMRNKGAGQEPLNRKGPVYLGKSLFQVAGLFAKMIFGIGNICEVQNLDSADFRFVKNIPANDFKEDPVFLCRQLGSVSQPLVEYRRIRIKGNKCGGTSADTEKIAYPIDFKFVET